VAACTGAPWRDVPEKYGKWNSIYRRFRRWSACGVWESVAIALAETMAESGHYDIDSTTVRAHVSAAGRKGGCINELLAARGVGSPVKFIVSVMPEAAPSNRTKTICYNKRLYCQRNCIERVLGHLKINRAIATRYDQFADSFLGMLYLATARYWIKFVNAA